MMMDNRLVDISTEQIAQQVIDLMKQEKRITYHKICFYLAYLGQPEISLEDYQERAAFVNIPQNVKAIVEETKGQLIFKTQAYKLFGSATKGEFEAAKQWVNDWNKKVPAARTFAKEAQISGVSLAEIIQTLSPFKENQFFITEPKREAIHIWRSLVSNLGF